ncbi:MAG: branched-chain amino acid transport system permease protein [Solirubrobacteraceae bacterium]|nr:branched-chain amino acid transport system permease protein [Solirubrobacteraceae bacterium]
MFLELLINGISYGCIYALVAIGFVIVFKSTNVINFAHASVLTLGAYLIAKWHKDLHFWPSVLLAALVCAVAAALLDFVLIRPLRKRRGGEESLAIITIGINVLLATALDKAISTDILSTGAPGGSKTSELLGVTIADTRITAMVVAVILIGILFLVFERTDLGVGMRATAADPETAALMGIRLGRIAAVSWAIAGALAAVAGAFFAAYPAAGVTNRTSLLALTAIPAAVVGGLDSLLGAVVGGLIIGIASSFVTGYQDNLDFLGRGLSGIVPYIVLFAVLLWRPSGLFGQQSVTRV